MKANDILMVLGTIDSICADIAQTLFLIDEAYHSGRLTNDERNSLIQEIRDIRAAQECAGNEIAFRYVVQACNVLLAAA
jgi:hypothetical protein